MEHKTVKVTELKVGDVLCPYPALHFHYTVEEIYSFPTSKRVGLSTGKGHFEAFGELAEFEIVED